MEVNSVVAKLVTFILTFLLHSSSYQSTTSSVLLEKQMSEHMSQCGDPDRNNNLTVTPPHLSEAFSGSTEVITELHWQGCKMLFPACQACEIGGNINCDGENESSQESSCQNMYDSIISKRD